MHLYIMERSLLVENSYVGGFGMEEDRNLVARRYVLIDEISHFRVDLTLRLQFQSHCYDIVSRMKTEALISEMHERVVILVL
jgi:hypothetical protein